MGSHSVTCHLAEVTFPPLPQQIRLVHNLETPEGCKVELTSLRETENLPTMVMGRTDDTTIRYDAKIYNVHSKPGSSQHRPTERDQKLKTESGKKN